MSDELPKPEEQDKPKRLRPQLPDDISALSKIHVILQSLPTDARLRVLAWLMDSYKDRTVPT